MTKTLPILFASPLSSAVQEFGMKYDVKAPKDAPKITVAIQTTKI